VSILKPLKGCDAETEACLRSWFEQEFAGPMEILLGVDDPDDPVCKIAGRILGEYPGVPARLVVCDERAGPNPKVSKLVQLSRIAQYDLFCVSDADVFVPRDFLANVVEPLRDPGVGLVNCFYRLANPANFAMRWEAFAVNADFWGQVLQSVALRPMAFALGAVMVAPRRRIEAVGGFRALADYLADDHELGQRMVRNGGKVSLCPIVVDCRTAPMRFREVWNHQVRWGRTIRACQPGPYFLSILGNATLWPLLLMAVRPGREALAAGALALGWRMLQGSLLERRMTGRWQGDSLWLAPIKDLLHTAIWFAALSGSSVLWRGERFEVGTEGKMMPLSRRPPCDQPGWTPSHK